MALLQNANAIPTAAGGGEFYSHQIANSCRFNRASSDYLSRTIQTGGDLKKWTISFWVKLTASAGFGSNQYHILTALDNAIGSYDTIMFDVNAASQLYFQAGHKYFTGAHSIRDPSAWYHVVIIYDSANSTAAYRKRVWFNNIEDTGSDVETLPLNTDSQINDNSVHYIGARQDANASYFMDGYFADFIFVDAQAYAPTYFGEEKNGVWIPKDYKTDTGEYGTTGYHLDFADSSALGNDVSGNNNDWTANNLTASDQMTDSPTFSATDGNGGNFMTYNGAYKGSNNALAEGNLKSTGSAAGNNSGTFGMLTGKWYWECRAETVYVYGPTFGIGQSGAGGTDGQYYIITWQTAAGQMYGGGGSPDGMGTITVTSTGVTSLSSGDILSFWLDCDNGKLWVGKNGTIPNSGAPASGTNPQASWSTIPTNRYFTATCQNVGSGVGVLNAGQNPTFNGAITAGTNTDKNGYGLFNYDPSGTDFVACCAGNIPTADAVDPAQTDANYPQKLFSPLLYTGDGGTTQAQTGLGFQPDFTYIKQRNGTAGWKVFDSTRGVTKYVAFHNDDAETTETDSLKVFGSDGFSVGSNNGTGASSSTYASGNWRANGGTTAANSLGDIATVTQVDPSGCFSIVTYTGDGVAGQTLGHGLSVAPDMIIVKNRDQVASWVVYHSATGNAAHFILDTDAAYTTSSAYWGSTTPTSTVWTTGNDGKLNSNTEKYVAYCFANCEGYIKAGSYIGNANADGAFVYTGFKPAWIMNKPIVAGNWRLADNARSPYNVSQNVLMPNSAAAQDTYASVAIDILSNGIKMRSASTPMNQATTYVYLAMASNPFAYATAR